MNENKNEGGTLNSDVEEVIEVAEDATQEQKDEALARLQDTNKQLYARAKKAEGFELVDGKWVKKEKPPVIQPKKEPSDTTTISKEKMSQSDLIAVVKADVPEEDLEDVIEYATLKKISVREALNAPLIKGMLAEKAEQRAIAEGTNTNGARRGNTKISDTELLSNAQKGVMPESEEDMARLIKLRRASK